MNSAERREAAPHEFFTEAINSAKGNVGEAIRIIEEARTIDSDKLLRIAEIQAEMAKAAGLVIVAQAIQACSTPGQSIRYGMAEVAEALKSISEPRT
jgi:hypothetical protein